MGQSFSICTPSVKRGRSPLAPAACIQLQCVQQGADGCFLCPSPQLLQAMWDNAESMTVTPFGRPALQPEQVRKLLDAVRVGELCFKVFINDRAASNLVHYTKEMTAVRTLEGILGDELVDTHTTYANID